MRIKKFNEEIGFNTINRERNQLQNKLIDNLKAGFCVKIDFDDITTFKTLLTNKGIENLNCIDNRDGWYYILLGNRLIPIEDHFIGDEELEVYIPSFR